MTAAHVVVFPARDGETASVRPTVSWILEDSASIVESEDGSLIVRHRRDDLMLRWVLKALDDETHQTLRTLGARRRIGSAVGVADASTLAERDRLFLEMNRLLSGRLLSFAVGDPGGTAHLVVRPQGGRARVSLPLAVPRKPVRLSAYVTVRRGSDGVEVSSPVHGFVLESRGFPIGNLLMATAERAGDPQELIAELERGLPHEEAVSLVAVLTATGVLGEVDDTGRLAEERDAVLVQRQPADVAFHHASRLGLHPGPTGATWRFAGVLPPTPALRAGAVRADEMVRLEPGDPAGTGGDVGFTEVVARRKSTRRHGAVPLSVRQLGEFLHRVARVDRVIPADDSSPRNYELSVRPYPSGGGAYELELYLVIGRCAGLAPGLYRYRPVEHGLEPIAATGTQRAMLLENSRVMSGAKEPPQVLVILAARFNRLSWKYENMAYSTTLKNVGVLYELMYLTAAAMGLACCALGNGDSGLFAEAAGLRVEEESSVGELILGSMPDREREGAEGQW